jgi:hypothetical protein
VALKHLDSIDPIDPPARARQNNAFGIDTSLNLLGKPQRMVVIA